MFNNKQSLSKHIKNDAQDKCIWFSPRVKLLIAAIGETIKSDYIEHKPSLNVLHLINILNDTNYDNEYHNTTDISSDHGNNN